jgi:hypothetical protein
LLSAKDSYNDLFLRNWLCHSRARVWRARGIPNPAPGGPKKIRVLGAAATGENDKQEIQQDQNRHYDMQDSIVAKSAIKGEEEIVAAPTVKSNRLG